MLKLIRQLVQKLKKDKKVETQDSSSHSNDNTFVVGSQNQNELEFEIKYLSLVKRGMISYESLQKTKKLFFNKL